MNDILKGALFVVGFLLIILIITDIYAYIRYDQYESDCKEGESFQDQAWILDVGKCVKSADAEFCERVQRCVGDEMP